MVLRGIEQKIEALFEGVFGRAFRTNVQPVELARKLAKEMDEHRVVSVSRVYVPNEYTIFLSADDREQFEGYENSLLAELEEYLSEHARRESYALLTPARVKLETDEDLGLGEFGIATRMVQPRHGHRGDEPEEQVESGATMIYKHPVAEPTEAASPEELGLEREVAVLTWDGHRLRVDKRRVLLGRSRECDVQIEDANISRRHAELRQEGTSFWIVDLDSTNGVEVNGQKVKRSKLEPGDRFTVGSTEVTFSTERE
jgi:FhaA, N-terminal domain/FHA domain